MIIVNLPELGVRVRTMRVGDGPLPLMRESTEDVATPVCPWLPLHSNIDGILAKAATCVMPEVSSGGLVAFVLITPNASCLSLAFLRCTSEEVGETAIVYLNFHLGFEKRVYMGSPSFLGCC